jgi:uncharacterized protein (TIGR00162 family)
MKDIDIKWLEEPGELNDPILIEGLPGVGNVGKLAADHLIEELDAEQVAEIHSPHFPPQVLMHENGTVRLVNNEVHVWENPDGGRDLVILIGDYQGLTGEGQYALANAILDIMDELSVGRFYTLGGYGTGQILDEARVLGAATHEPLVEEMKEHGVVFSKDEPGGGIVGASGLLLGLGKSRDIEGICLMGETSGYLVDPRSARALLEVLAEIFEMEIDFSDLEDRAQQMDKLTQQLRDIESQAGSPSEEGDLQYIG